MAGVTPEYVLSLTGPTEKYLCPLSANIYNIEFYRFTIRDMHDTNKVYFDVERTPEQYRRAAEAVKHMSEQDLETTRRIFYKFPASLLRKGTVGARLVFGVNGDKPLKSFRMIERHYFRNALVKSFDFDMGFCIPHSTNTWEAIYDLPNLSAEWEKAIVENPNETLVLHNKAYYAYDKPE
eukprot:gene10324-7218_t